MEVGIPQASNELSKSMDQLLLEHVLHEFSGLTNDQAYVHVFSKRMMKPVPNREGEFFGTDQRIDMLPFIRKQVESLPKNAQVFDVGAGAGDVVEFALKEAPQGTVVNIEEPNPNLIKAYLSKLKKYKNLKTGAVIEGPLQDCYQKKSVNPKAPQNLILAIHMIYHLTDFTKAQINPEKDLIDAISFLYGLLEQNGSIFIVYADLLATPRGEAVCSLAEKFFRYKYPNKKAADHLVAIYKARNKLLGPNGLITTYLAQKYPRTKPILHSEKRDTHFFGETIADIAVLGLATELCPSNAQKFDLEKLQFCLDYVSKHPERIGLQKEERNIPQKGMWRANEPQVIATITKLP